MSYYNLGYNIFWGKIMQKTNIVKKIFTFITLFIIFTITLLLIPSTNSYILTGISTYFLHVNTKFHVNKISLDRYSAVAILNNKNRLYVQHRILSEKRVI